MLIKNFSVVIPIYNEAENILQLLDEILINLKNFTNYEIIVVDDFSNDESYKLITSKYKNTNLKIQKNNKNLGQSLSIINGCKISIYDTIVTLDGDGQNDPSDIPELLKIYFSDKKIKLVSGIRTKRKDNLIKIYSSKIANSIRSRILNDNCVDTGCSLKVFDKNIFLTFPRFDGLHRFIPALFKYNNCLVLFHSVSHRKRKFGKSKYGTLLRLFKGLFDMYKVYKIINNK